MPKKYGVKLEIEIYKPPGILGASLSHLEILLQYSRKNFAYYITTQKDVDYRKKCGKQILMVI